MSKQDQADEILGLARERLDRGQLIDVEELAQEHPELADEIRIRFAALRLLDDAFASVRLETDGRVPGRPGPGQRIGRFRLHSELGAGGMGTVFLASVEEPGAGPARGRQVALKAIHPHLISRPEFFERFRREAETGQRIRHPNVVATYELGSHEDGDAKTLFLAMEFVEGDTLRDLLLDMEVVPEALLREIGRQVAAGLTAVHAAGVVHRDLKPENILVTRDHHVRIMDLGVARIVEETGGLTREGQFAGSVRYAAPEQFHQGEVRAAADLYAMGVTLFELATGVHPFPHEVTAAVIRAHLDEEPRLASERNPDVSPFLSEVIATLLAKDPRHRFGSAAELHDVLAAGEASPWWLAREHEARAASAHRPRIPVRRDTPLHGRGGELRLIDEAWERALTGEGQSLLIVGEAGIGKSRLIDAVVERYGEAEARILYGAYPPFGGIGGIADGVLRELGGARLEERLRPYLAESAALADAFAALIRRAPLPDGAPPLEGDALHAAAVSLMRGFAREKPLLWIIEDLHCASPDSRRVLLSLTRATEGHRVLLILTSRPDLPQIEMSHFSRLPTFRRVELPRLSTDEIVGLLAEVFGEDELAQRLGRRIAQKSDGVPFFVFEMIRSLREDGSLVELEDGTWREVEAIDRIEVPAAVRDLIDARLRELTEQERVTLDLAAVQGHEFDADLLAQVLGRKRVAVLQELAELERRNGVVRASGRGHRFDHHLVQEVLYADLAPALRAEYHASLAEARQAQETEIAPGAAPTPSPTAVFIADHHLEGSRPREARPYILPAIQHLTRQLQNQPALDLASRALGHRGLLDPPERAVILLEKADRLAFLGRMKDERRALDEALEIARNEGQVEQEIAVRGALARHLLHVGRLDDASAEVRHSLDLTRTHGDRHGEMRVLSMQGLVERSLGRLDRARTCQEASLSVARELGDRRGEEAALGNLGTVFNALHRFDEAATCHEQSREIARAEGDVLAEAKSTGNLGIVHYRCGRYDEARTCFQAWLETARRAGHRRSEAAAQGSLGNLHLKLGNHEEARRCHEADLAISREIGDAEAEATAQLHVANTAFVLGRFEEAQDLYRRVLEIEHERENLGMEASVVSNLGIVAFDLGHFADALVHYQNVIELARKAGNRVQEGLHRSNLGYLLLMLGDREAAAEAITMAIRTLQATPARGTESFAHYAHGVLDEYEGRIDEARARFERALELQREAADPYGIAESLTTLGRYCRDAGEVDRAAAMLDEAIEIASRHRIHAREVLATIHRAALPGGHVERACALLEERRDLTDVPNLLKACFSLWKITSDPAHLTEAHELLRRLQAGAPPAYRETMVENVPLHRAVRDATRGAATAEESA